MKLTIRKIILTFNSALFCFVLLNACMKGNKNLDDTPKSSINLNSYDNILITAYLVPFHDEEMMREQMQYCKDADIDIISHVYFEKEWTKEQHTFENYKKAAAIAKEYGLKVLTRETRVQDFLLMSSEDIVKVVNEYKDMDGIGGFFIIDEPFNPSEYADVINTVASAAPNLIADLNFLPISSYKGDEARRVFENYAMLTYGYDSILSFDAYCFGLDGGVNETALFSNLDTVRAVGLRNNKNTGVYVQSVGLEGNYRTPDIGTLRYNMMASLAYGFKQIKFFTWGTPNNSEGQYTTGILDREYKPTELYYGVIDVNKKIHQIGKRLAKLDAVEIYHTNSDPNVKVYNHLNKDFPIQPIGDTYSIISLLESRETNQQYVMIVNKDFEKKQNLSFKVKGINTLTIINEKTGEEEPLNIKDGEFSVQLEAGDGALIKLPKDIDLKLKKEKQENLALNKICLSKHSESSENFSIYNLTDGAVNSKEGFRSSSKNETSDVIIDLGEEMSFDRIDLYPCGVNERCGLYYPKSVKIYNSSDGVKWEQLINGDTNRGAIKTVPVYEFDEIKARFIKIEAAGHMISNSYIFELGEIEVYSKTLKSNVIETAYSEPNVKEGENIALNKPVIAYSSTTDVPAWNCHNTYINDGNLNTAWASLGERNETANAEEYIIIDLISIYSVNKVKIYPRDTLNGLNCFPNDYEIQVSTDGKEFVTVKQVKGDNEPQNQKVRILEFSATDARYIKFVATKLTHSSTSFYGYTVELNELEVYGNK